MPIILMSHFLEHLKWIPPVFPSVHDLDIERWWDESSHLDINILMTFICVSCFSQERLALLQGS